MRENTFKISIEALIVALMLFGWAAMLFSGIKESGLEGDESAETTGETSSAPLRYGFHVFLIATLVFVFLSRRRTVNERLSMGLIVFGLFSLCQPFTIALYRCGFQTLLVGTLAFIIASHMKADIRDAKAGKDAEQ